MKESVETEQEEKVGSTDSVVVSTIVKQAILRTLVGKKQVTTVGWALE